MSEVAQIHVTPAIVPNNDEVNRETRQAMEVEDRRRQLEGNIRRQLLRLQDAHIYPDSQRRILWGDEVVEAMKDIDPDRYVLALALVGTSHDHQSIQMLAELKAKAVDKVIQDHSVFIYKAAAKSLGGSNG